MGLYIIIQIIKIIINIIIKLILEIVKIFQDIIKFISDTINNIIILFISICSKSNILIDFIDICIKQEYKNFLCFRKSIQTNKIQSYHQIKSQYINNIKLLTKPTQQELELELIRYSIPKKPKKSNKKVNTKRVTYKRPISQIIEFENNNNNKKSPSLLTNIC